MTTLTPEQIAIIKPVLDDLEYDFFDVVGRLDEQAYAGHFQIEAYKAALALYKEHKIPQFAVYKHIRQNSLELNDFRVEEEFNVIARSVQMGIQMVRDVLNSDR